MTDLIIKLLQRAAISSVEKQDLHLQLVSHEDYPSLKAVTDTLDYFGIENVAANVPKDALPQLPKSFLALLQKENASQLVFASQNNGYVTTIDEFGKKKKLTIASFQEAWTGTIIAIEVTEKEKRIMFPKVSLKLIIPIVVFATAITAIGSNGIDFVQSIYLILGAIGLGVSYLIVLEAQGEGSELTAKVCNTISSNAKGCGAVINSSKGKITKDVGLGDLSLIFFSSTVIISTYLGVNISALLIVAGVTLPFVGYAIFSQAFVIKDWCFLCLGITAILISQFVILLTAFTTWDFSLAYILQAMSLGALVSGSWILIKPLLERSTTLKKVQKDFLSLKRNETVFKALLDENSIENLVEVPEDAKIHFGTEDGALQLTAYTNPLCGFCTEAFEGYDALLSQFPEDVGVSFVFNTPSDTDNPSTKISKRIIELYDSSPKEAWDAMKAWFEIKDTEAWTSLYGSSTSMLLKSQSILETHRVLIEANKINYTPETLLGNAMLPRTQYAYKDLALFINYYKENKANPIVLETVY